MGTGTFNFDDGKPIEIYPGAVHYPGFLSLDEQVRLLDRCRQLERQSAGFYTPQLSSGHKMSIRVLCLGLHWDAKRYSYDTLRSDVDGKPVDPVPEDFIAICNRLARRAQPGMVPDICIINQYGVESKLGLHQDKSEPEATLMSGAPVVSISIGAEAEFKVGGFDKSGRAETIILKSGDGFVFGGLSRLRYHGIKRVRVGTEPPELGLTGRYNITFRQYWIDESMRASRAL